MPELYLQTVVDAVGEEKYVVVDGQQRIRACMAFLAGEFALGDDSGALAGSFFDELEDEQKKQIFEYKFVVRELPQLSEPEIRGIFERLNRNNVALNAQEIRHATYWGEFISTMKEISQDEFWVTSGVFTSNDIRRMLDIEFVSELAVAHLYGLQNKKASLDKYYKNFESEFPDRREIEKIFRIVLGELGQILKWPTRTRWSKKTDFYTLFLVMAKHVTAMPFDRDLRQNLTEKLEIFSTNVASHLSVTDNDDSNSIEQALGYSRGVRASSDLGSRKIRNAALESYLFGLPYELPEVLDEDEIA
ncbi:hypothetical protein RN04_01895 [Arthrobacter sp. W1]|nr:hypothetical protein RN04_01895 [Arthrobacter sp. W1]